jgi:hypothetical protein
MLKQIVVVGACILALMVVVKDGRAIHVAGLRGSCSITGTYRDSSLLVACRAGRLDGRPDLSRRACASVQVTHALQYWHCTAGFDVSYATR